MATNKIKTKGSTFLNLKKFLKNLKLIFSNQLYQIIGIFLLALIIRLFKLEDFPNGFHIDEVKVGWNTLSILNTFRDDQGNLLPLYYNTFGDYRPTGIFYFSIPALAIFGNSVFAVRLTSAVFGALTVFPLFFLAKEIFKKEKNVGLYASLILAIVPWHIAVSRATSEVVISGFFVLTTLYFAVKNKNRLTFISILCSYVLYHSSRILVPAYLFFGSFFNRINKKYFLFATLITLLLSLGNESKERFKQVSIFKNEDIVYELQKSGEPKIFVYSRNLIREYGKYFSTDFLIGDSKPYRYLTPGIGLINYIDLMLLVVGIYLIFKNRKGKFVVYLLFLSPLVAILTSEDSPNLHRSMYMVLFISIIEGYALSKLKFQKEIIALLAISLIYFLMLYFKPNMKLPYQKNLYIDSPTYRNIGNIELVNKINTYKDEYDEIYITNFPDNLYTWYVFLNNLDPKKVNHETYIKNSNERRYLNIIFTDYKCPSDYVFNTTNKKVIAIDSYECPIESKIKDGLNAKLVGEIKRPDQSNVYAIFSSP